MSRLARVLLVVMGGIGLSALAFYRLALYPPTWFDEGSHLHVPKALVRWGVYADYSSEGFRFSGPILGVGPTVLLPIAGAFQVFGVDLWPARWVMAGYLLLTASLFFAMARRWVPGSGAAFATLWFVFARSLDTVAYGRQVLGEVPAMAFLALGLIGWARMARDRQGGILMAGVGFGLALITKNQWGIFLIPGLVAMAILGRTFYRERTWAGNLAIAGVALGFWGVWQGILWGLLNPDPVRSLTELRTIAGGSVMVFPSPRMGATARSLLTVFDGAFLPLLLYVAARSAQRTPEGYRWGMIGILAALNIGWLVTASNGWLRYAYPGLALLSLGTGGMLEDLRRQAKKSWGLSAALTAWLAVLLLGSAGVVAARVARGGDGSAFEMARYLRAHIPEAARIETWEPEMMVLTDHRYHQPPQPLLDVASRFIWFGGPPPSAVYRWEADDPDYVLVGAFGRWVQLYREVEESCPPVASFGPYRLYAPRECAALRSEGGSVQP
ncbi:ArnT family glycosyltransferase [Thermoflexus hugenholtzii]